MQACTRVTAFGLWSLLLTGCVGEVVESSPRFQVMNPFTGVVDAGGSVTGDPNFPDVAPGVTDGGRPGGQQVRLDGGAIIGETDAGSLPEPPDPCAEQEPLAHGLGIQELALYQTIKIPLMQSGQWIADRAAPIVQGKRALLRVFVAPEGSYNPHPVLARVTLTSGGSSRQLEQTLSPTGPSADAAPASTFNFELEPADLGVDTQISVALLETDCTGASVGGASASARYPAAGAQRLDVQAIGKLRVVLVPVDNGGYLPDTSPTQITKLREALSLFYPVSDVEITVDDALAWPYRVSASAGWTDLLNEIINERARDRPERDVYYYGLVAPSPDLPSYCGWGCMLGVAPVLYSVTPSHQVGLGIGFAAEETYSTIAHELGHAHGREHAPMTDGCGPQPEGVDRLFPDPAGHTDVWGWDPRSNSLVEPSAYDVMGYCEPAWISEYTYEALASRSLLVNTSFKLSAESEPTWKGIVQYDDGTSRWTATPTHEPGGHPLAADVLDESGAVLAEVSVVIVELSHSADTFLYVPELPPEWATLRLPDRTLRRVDILPALSP